MAETGQPAQGLTLCWGVKESFRRYVEAAGGTITTDGGAERAADGVFAFPAAPDNDLRLTPDGKLEGRGGFLGEVRFEAHGGMLSVRLADLAIEVAASSAMLSVADGARRAEIAQLDLAAADPGHGAIPTSLTMDGSWLLGDHYPPRTALDPVRLTTAQAKIAE